ncbi:hypothetical protein MRB53_031385 [Persea americana]|uniref:Uncharacterized protein n=1 Tax=Persea americana TaxID=3435 RepID=A0ACC2KNT7_PERAE|nr:hypothetical protein MRB53_031385 [Persea americana]
MPLGSRGWAPQDEDSSVIEFKHVDVYSATATWMAGESESGGRRWERWCCTNNNALLLIKCFAVGVILSTSLVHVLPDAFDALADCQITSLHPWKDFPFFGFIAMVGAIIALLVDIAASSHVEDRPQYAPIRLEDGGTGGVVAVKNGEAAAEVVVVTGCHNMHEEELAKLKQRPMSQILEIWIVFHLVIIRVTLEMSQNRCTIKPLVVALAFHQIFEGMGPPLLPSSPS